jgi:spore maturation protein CgeB
VWSLRRVRRRIAECSPDFIFTNFEDYSIASFGVKVVFWRLEIKHSDGRGGDRFRDGFAEKCTYVFEPTMDSPHFLPVGVRPEFFHPVKTPKLYRASFTGSWYPDREDGLKKMLYPFGKDADVFGRDWKGHEHEMNCHGFVDWSKLSEIYSKAVFNIDVHHPEVVRKGGINLRFLEVLASGGLLVSDHTKNMEQMAIPGRDFILVKDGENAKEVTASYTEEERAGIAASGRKTFLERHTTADRAEKILEVANTL